MVPKVIHCCWFGGPKTKLAERCLASWRRFAPGWEIREWDEEKARGKRKEGRGWGEDDGYRFFEAAIAARKWAMASDWLRMKVLCEEGGIYLDFDVELVATVDRLPDGEWVSGEWTANGGVWMNPGGGIALEKGSAVARHMLEAYESLRFDPKFEMMPWINARLAETGLRTLAPEVMSPIGMDGKLRSTERTVAVHHYATSWASPTRKVARWLSWHGMRPVVDALLRMRRAASARRGLIARVAMAAAVVLTAASVVKGVINSMHPGGDFHWESAALFLRGENPYAWFFAGRMYEGLIVDATQAPSSIAFILPFGLVPYPVAEALWTACNLGFSAVFLYFLWKLFFGRRNGFAASSFWIFAMMFLAGIPWRVGMECGQHAMFSVMFFVAAVWAMESGRHWALVGALLSAALFKYTITAPLAFIFVIRRQWKAIGVAVAIHVAATAALGWRTGTDPVLLVLQSMKVGAALNPSGGDADLAGLAKWFGCCDVWPWAITGYAAFALAIPAYSLWRMCRGGRGLDDLAIDMSALGIMANMCCYHRCYDLLTLAFPLVLCFRWGTAWRAVPLWLLVLNAFFLVRVGFAFRHGFKLGFYTPMSFLLHAASLAVCVWAAASRPAPERGRSQ